MQISIDGTEIYCATGGRPFDPEKPSALFLHGAGMDHSYWPLQARWFAWHGWNAIVPDLPAHGRSAGQALPSIAAMTDWVASLMAALQLERAALIGHSMGGAIALEAAARFGPRATHLVMFGSAAAIPVHEMLLSAAEKSPETAHQMMTEWGHGASSKMGGNTVPGMWMTGSAKALLSRNRPGVLHADLKACNEWLTGAAAAAKVECQALVVTATGDAMTPQRKGAELAKAVPCGRVEALDNCGHMMLQEAPDACLDALIKFMGPA